MTTDKHFDEYGDQTKVKHAILRQYLSPWAGIIGKTHSLNYLDGFAGRGHYIEDGEEKDGSPVLAIKEFDKIIERIPGCDIFCGFTEKKPEYADQLRSRLSTLTTEVRWNVGDGTFSQLMDLAISVGETLAPTFAFVDPCGWSGYPFSQLANFMTVRRNGKGTELFINFMFNAINEWFTANVDNSLKVLYGMTDEELDALRKRLVGLSPSEREQTILGEYVLRLRKISTHVLTFRVKFPDKDRTFFYLIHCTNHWLGVKIMKDIMYKLAGKRLEFAALGRTASELTLFPDDYDQGRQEQLLGEMMLTKYSGRKVTFQTILEETYQYTPCRVTNYRKRLKAMRKEGRLDFEAVVSTQKGALDEQDYVIFP